MLEFNQDHKSADLSSIKTKIDKAKNVAKAVIYGVAFSALLLLSGCNKTMDCSRQDRHFQIYIKDGIVKIIDSEKEKIKGFTWTEGTIDYSIELENELKLLEKHDLLKISDNNSYFIDFINNNATYTQYEYSYVGEEVDYYISPFYGVAFTPVSIRTTIGADGNLITETCVNIPVYKTVEKTAWSNDENVPNFTGNMQDVLTKYCAYRIIEDNEGKVILEKSPEVDNILDIASEYPYFKLNDYCVKEYIPHHIEKSNQR